MTDQNVDLDVLDKLHAAATPGEWQDDAGPSNADVITEPNEEGEWEFIAENAKIPDAALIVALHNAYPALAAEIRELQAELEDETALRQLAKELPDMHSRVDRLQTENAALRARVEELGNVLHAIATARPALWDIDVRDQFQPWAQNIARDALATKEQPEEKPHDR